MRLAFKLLDFPDSLIVSSSQKEEVLLLRLSLAHHKKDLTLMSRVFDVVMSLQSEHSRPDLKIMCLMAAPFLGKWHEFKKLASEHSMALRNIHAVSLERLDVPDLEVLYIHYSEAALTLPVPEVLTIETRQILDYRRRYKLSHCTDPLEAERLHRDSLAELGSVSRELILF
jgi:hypothetical protein